MKLLLITPIAIAIAIGGAACSPTPDKTCQSASGARICLNALGGPAFTVTGSGLKPGSEVQIHLPGPGGPFSPSHVDSHGNFPEGGSMATIGEGLKASTIPIDATSGNGTAVTFTFHLPAAER